MAARRVKITPSAMPPGRPRRSSKGAARPALGWSAVRLFAMDVDGVLTDGTVQVSSDGSEAKSFSILDGLGLRELERAGIVTAWISGRPSGATSRRARELGVPHLVMGRNDKLAALQELAQRLALSSGQCAYMGDDTIDVPAISWAGIGIAPPLAIEAALAAADYITRRPAGHGAVREVCDRMLAARAEARRSGRSKARGAGSEQP
jgi:3-deoxy-D-manno-octulosonate 8-phosphate phosphatase (KDO 8-P phosphatase)